MNQVQEESRIANIVGYIKMVWNALTVNETIANDSNIEKELKEIIAQEDSKKIAKLEEQTTSVYIPLKESSKIVAKAEVSEAKAQRRANEVSIEKNARKNENQKQREE